jgi:glycogen debranching enzyme
LVIKGIKEYHKIMSWEEKTFSRDKERNSKPYSQWVYKTLTFHVHGNSELIFAEGRTKNEGVRKANSNIKIIKAALNAHSKKLTTKNESLTQAIKTLDSLTIRENPPKILAGMPWFNQEWRRDEAISSIAYHVMGNSKLAKQILLKYVKGIGKFDTKESQNDSELQNSANLETKQNTERKSCDARLIAYTNILKLLKNNVKFTKYELKQIYTNVIKNIHYIQEKETRNSLYYNEMGETWMDSISRRGRTIEMQSLLLSTIELAAYLTKMLNEDHASKYEKLLELTKKKVKKEFKKKGTNWDSIEGKECTNNIFLAHYYYSSLYTNKEWEEIFDKALDELWIYWGGISTLSIHSKNFQRKHTGENPISYHQGDSWFFMNNIAALSMKQVNKKKYSKYINKIIEATSKSLENSCPEVSSAEELKQEGSWLQAWTASTFIELVY